MAQNKSTSSAAADARDLLADTVAAGAGDDAVATGDFAAEGAAVTEGAGSDQGLSPEIIEQLSQAADNLEAARGEAARLQGELDTATAALAVAMQDLENERRSHDATRDELTEATAVVARNAAFRLDGGNPPEGEFGGGQEDVADWIADGLFVMKTSKIPDETGALAPRGRLAIIGDKRAGPLVEEGHARPATRADVVAAKRPPVRI